MRLALVVSGRISAAERWKWQVLWIGAGALGTVIFLSTDTPVGHLLDIFIIDPQTACFRLYIGNMVVPAILQNPFSVW
jgi:hypothetical protein